MPKYKITKVFVVISASKAAALLRAEMEPNETMDYLSVVEQSAEPQPNGFLKSVRSQVTGK